MKYKEITDKQRELMMKLLVEIHDISIVKSPAQCFNKPEVIEKLNVIFEILERKEKGQ